MATPSSKDAAQRRADQIGAFRAELDALAREGASPFVPVQLAAVAAHHDRLLRQGRRQVARFCHAGDLVGLTGDSWYPYTADALTEVSVVRIRRAAVAFRPAHGPDPCKK